ncbi:MAG TPA: hypothetical protein PKB15_08180 [Acidimicrobiia bacterium]|nr:hypothetical protein [Acidimicrobiia bacterium]
MTLRTFTIHPTTSQDSASDQDETLILRCDTIDFSDACIALGTGEIKIIGQLSNSSNGALLGEIENGDTKISVVVKPAMYENPLYDFEWGTLAKREVGAYEISHLLGWNIVPPTVLRDVRDMQSSVQLFIPHDPREHYFTLSPGRRDIMEKFAAFDYIINNADRKGGHILAEKTDSFELFLEPDVSSDSAVTSMTELSADDRVASRFHATQHTLNEDGSPSQSTSHLWGIDHGLSFHIEDKLRTVIWEFSEEPISISLMDDVNRIHAHVKERLLPLVSAHEIEATITRVERLLMNPYHRALDANDRAFPWPLV